MLVGGNVSTIEATKQLAEWGVDAIRIGQGSGSICTTALAIGISRASATGVYECARIKEVAKIEGKLAMIDLKQIDYKNKIKSSFNIFDPSYIC